MSRRLASELQIQEHQIKITADSPSLSSFSDSCQKKSDGRNTLLVFYDGFQKLLKDVMANRDIESEPISMTKLVKAIRNDWAEYGIQWKISTRMSRNLCTSKSKNSCCDATG